MTSEVMLKAWAHSEDFEGRSSIYSWIKKIAQNRYIDFIRRNKKVHFTSIHENGRFLEGTNEWEDMEFEDKFALDPPNDFDSFQLGEDIDNIVSVAKEYHKEAIDLYYYDENDIKSIAKRLNIPEGTVKSRLSRARKAIKRKIEIRQEFDEDWHLT